MIKPLRPLSRTAIDFGSREPTRTRIVGRDGSWPRDTCMFRSSQPQAVQPEITAELRSSVRCALTTEDLKPGANRVLWQSPDGKSYITVQFSPPDDGKIVVYHK